MRAAPWCDPRVFIDSMVAPRGVLSTCVRQQLRALGVDLRERSPLRVSRRGPLGHLPPRAYVCRVETLPRRTSAPLAPGAPQPGPPIRRHRPTLPAAAALAAPAACPSTSGPDDGDDGGSGTVRGLGPGASLGGRRPFPADNPWNRDISGEPVDP